MGVDPGTQTTGYGLIKITAAKTPILLQYGVIHLSKYKNHAHKLQKIFNRLLQIIDDYHPDEMALEAPFYGKNVQSMLKLGRAQGVGMAAALSREIPIVEYAPKKIKMVVTGKGNATKAQVATMLMRLLNFKQTQPFMLDATDALAVALCHFYRQGQTQHKAGSWKTFAAQNPGRIKH